MTATIIDMMWDAIQKDIDALKRGQSDIQNKTEQAQYVDGIPAFTFANLPANGLANGTTYVTVAWVTNGRKSGEGAGNGTGVLAVYNPGSSTWKRVGEDYNDVTV